MSLALLALAKEKTRDIGQNMGLFLPPIFMVFMAGNLLNHVFREKIRDGELDVLNGRYVGIECTEWPYRLRVGLNQKQLVVDCSNAPCDAVIKGDYDSFLAMLQQKIDPDTLFFKRRLISVGDTELALAIKNFLDSVEWSNLPKPLQRFIQHL